ncbi:MAG: DUF3783 domain-containing protein, partial [Firmicutes bacterium]|nr:DUF3783 domain-containing protein [Bacillota bacterium]
MKKTTMFRRLVSMLMVFTMIFSMASAVYAGETEPAAEYAITAASNENGAVSVDFEKAAEGTAVTVTAEPNEGYVLTQVAYRTVAEDGTTGKTVAVSAADGVYTFSMPASDVEVGAAFQPADSPVLYNSGSSSNMLGVIGSKENNYSVYIANWDAFLHAGDQETEVYLTFDKRFLDIDGVTMTLESRQYGDGGYKVVGRQTYTMEQLQALAEAGETDETGYIINSVSIPVMEGKAYEEGLYQYCVVQFGCPTWMDAFGNPLYRWNYTGVDATILGADAKAPEPVVWLYNLDANSYRGSVVRQVLSELNVKAGTVNSENLGQSIGYLVDWEGYEPVENPYHSGDYDVEYMLMGNLSDAQMDLLLGAMDDNNIYVALKSIPTAWTAGKTFVEFFEIMAEESE